MTSENTITGRGGEFRVAGRTIARCTLWVGNHNLATTTEWGDSDGEGYTNRANGRKDYLFRVEGKYEEMNEVWEIFQPGDIVEARLRMKDQPLSFLFPRAVCLEFDVVTDINTEEVVGWKASWGADGRYIVPTPASAGAFVPARPAVELMEWADGDLVRWVDGDFRRLWS